jgi:hypothetical protein
MEAVIDSVRANTFRVMVNNVQNLSPVQYGFLRLAAFWPELHVWNADYWERIDPCTQGHYTFTHAICTKSKDLQESARLLHATVPAITIDFKTGFLTFTPTQHAESFAAIDYLKGLPLWRP